VLFKLKKREPLRQPISPK